MLLGPGDWLIIGAYLLFAVGAGIFCSRSASTGLVSYFAGDRSFPWWLIGVSMVATTFAADTPLAVTGIVARDGISGNWFWWSTATAHLLVVFLMARFWRRAEVLTDAELIELRYDGRPATVLRGFKAFFFAIVINCITMGWVIRAVGKIMHSFIRWEELTPGFYAAMKTHWPESFAVKDPGEGLSIVIMSLVAVFYASLGGLRSVVLTDLVQFVIAMVGALLFACFAVNHVGGLDALVEQLHELYPERADSLLSLLPQGAAGGALFAFLTYVTVQWWATHGSDGGGYFAQRIVSARDEHHAYKGTLLFTLTHYLVRTWPWILVGLVALVIFPLDPPPGSAVSEEYALVLADRESAYPVLIGKLLPSGLVGLLVASLIAAFMSTIDTHVNWGSSYLVNDMYARFLRKNATQKELVWAGRIATVLILLMALGITTRIDSIKGAWEFFTALGAGLGLPHLLRWVWWRVNAWSELAGLAAAALTAGALWIAAPELQYAGKLLITVGISTAAMLGATFAFLPVTIEHLEQFYLKVRPVGFWKPVMGPRPRQVGENDRRLARALALWVGALVLLFLSMYSLKELLVGCHVMGAVLTVAAGAGWWLMIRRGA